MSCRRFVSGQRTIYFSASVAWYTDYERKEVAMSLTNHGRIEIYTDERQITAENVIAVLRDGYNKHLTNYQDIDYLIRFEAGEQPILREKTWDW